MSGVIFAVLLDGAVVDKRMCDADPELGTVVGTLERLGDPDNPNPSAVYQRGPAATMLAEKIKRARPDDLVTVAVWCDDATSR